MSWHHHISQIWADYWIDKWYGKLESISMSGSHGDTTMYFFFKILDAFFSRSDSVLAISQESLVGLMWNQKEVHRVDTGSTMWPLPVTSPMALTFNFSRSNFKIAPCQELLNCSDWCETKWEQIDTGPTIWPFPLTTPMTLALIFQGHSLK